MGQGSAIPTTSYAGARDVGVLLAHTNRASEARHSVRRVVLAGWATGNRRGMDNGELTGTIEKYLRRRKAMNSRRWSTATNEQTKYLLTAWAAYIGGGEWERPDLDDVLTWVLFGASDSYKHRRLCALRTFYRHLAKWGWISADPTTSWPSIPDGEEDPRPIPDCVYAAALSGTCQTNQRMLQLGRLAGLRAAEIAAVHTDDLDGDYLRVVGKGAKVRRVAVHPQVRRIAVEAQGFVFPADDGGHWRSGTISVRLSGCLPAGWTAHNLRHAFATQLYTETSDLLLVARQLGHASTRTTQRYVKTRDDHALDVISKWAA